jgi:DNA-binding transcriptional LysR family regulator
MFNTLFDRKGLSLDRLRRFCEVARAGSISQAEESNRRVQSSYSRDIAALEAHFGFRLFGPADNRARSGRPLPALTPQGVALLSLATDILHRLEEFHDFSDRPKRIRIGGGATAMHWVVQAHLSAMMAALPDTTIDVCDCATQEEAVEALRLDRLDYAVVDESSVATAPFPQRAISLGTLSYSLYLHREAVDLAARHSANRLLSGTPWVALGDSAHTAAELVAELDRQGVAVRLAATLSSFRQAASLLRGPALAALFPTLAESEMTRLGFQRIQHPLLETVRVPISLLYNEEHQALRPYRSAVAETLGRIMSEPGGPGARGG